MAFQHSQGYSMTTRKGSSIVLALVALCGSPPSTRSQEPAGVGTRVALPAAEGRIEEIVPAGEADAIAQLKELTLKAMMTSVRGKLNEGKPNERDQHPKHHGFVVAKFTVLEDLPQELRVGLFREPWSYTAVIRFSNTRTRVDSVPDNHGMAIKLFGVKGEKLLEGEQETETQDFVLLDHPLFFAQDVSTLLEANKLDTALAGDKSLRESLEGLLPAQAAEVIVQAVAKKMPREAMIVKLRKKLISSPLAPDYFSTTPYKFGKMAVKYSAKPERTSVPSRRKMDGEDYLREAMVDQLTTLKQPENFGFYVQRQGRAMPIEDPTVEWMSAWEKVATIEILAQDFDFPERKVWGNGLSYNPWHALKEHRPLGGINRARKDIYPATSELRHKNLPPGKGLTEADIPVRSQAQH